MNYTFVSGIHGAGKTTLLQALSGVLPIKCFSISDLIRQGGNVIQQEDKFTKGIDTNQSIWKESLNRLELEANDKVVLDGHFALLNEQGLICPLPNNTFEGTNMEKIVVVTEKPEVIQKRLEDRDGSKWKLDLLKDFQKKEIEEAHKFAEDKNIPIFVYNSKEQMQELADFIG
ncbi:AAA family ATPase [Listeria sp. FSL L7-1582]|uniref:AAA family ATPase n=1 Tax=Listeria portnoyi TaxID=2713504 RepID=UPI00164DDF3B|nr:AAA family ATPase [Listeria portnoyi]MBC6310843.1 AAA family ATPase [Listeria portnoyi]